MDAPIGILDSGSGGLSIWREIVLLLPNESTVYVGDHGNMPYSDKTTDFIQKRVKKIIKFLLSKRAKCIIIACNTATVAGIETYRRAFPDVPIVGVVPVIKTAVTISKTRHIAVFSTDYTAGSAYQRDLIQKFAKNCVVESIGSTHLVSLIEKGNLSSPDISRKLTSKLSMLKHSDVDVLALGCTHFPFVRDQIRAIVGEDIEILDSGGAVARQLKRILIGESIEASGNTPIYEFYTTGDAAGVTRAMRTLLDRQITVSYANL